MSKKILVVDDDNLIRESVIVMLKSFGHEVVDADNGQKGLVKALEVHPDLVITDIRMPELDGLGMVAKIREDEWGKTVPIIILTNDETTDAINHALESGVTVYLSKVHLDPQTLSQQLVMALGDQQ